MSIEQNGEIVQLPRRSPGEWLKGKFCIDPGNIARLVYPLVQFIHEEKPDYLMALDSGARITGLALFTLYHELYGELPSKDHMIHFKKISHSFSPELIRCQLQPDISRILSLGEFPLLFIIDDCVNTGVTTLMLRLLVSELSDNKIRLRTGVMREFLAGAADVRSDAFSLARAVWRNDPNIIGVEYTDKIVPRVVRTPEAINLRKQVNKSVRRFASEIKQTSMCTEKPDSESIRVLIGETIKLQDDYNDRLTMMVIDRKLSPESLPHLKQMVELLEKNKAELISRFEVAEPVKHSDSGVDLGITALRLLHLLSLPDTPHLLDKYNLDSSQKAKIFVVPQEAGGILKEALSLLPFRENLVGFQIDQDHSNTEVIFFVQGEGEKLIRVNVEVGEKEKTVVAGIKKDKRILIAMEGGIAGHAIRALETARGLRDLGYEPVIVGSGYYARPFLDEGFTCLSPLNTDQTDESNRIINQARGEGKGLFFWDFGTVRKRVGELKVNLRDYVRSGVDLLLCDMNPLADIAVGQLQKETGRLFPSLTETHDIRLSPSRSLRALKVSNVRVGELLYRINHSRILSILDPGRLRFAVTHLLFNEIADAIMGLPLSVYDHFHGGGNSRIKFTDYVYGKDGTIQFCFKQDDNHRKPLYPVGLQVDRGKTDGSDRSEWEFDLSKGRMFVLNTQGSTYHKEAWNTVVEALAEMPDCFSVHTTGIKEDQLSLIYRNFGDQKQEVAGYKVGYIAGYRLSRMADVVINHGGFGTISQWLLAAAERIQEEQRTLNELVRSQEQEEIAVFLNNSRRISRSFSICNTFEQENNALSLNEAGGNNVCTVVTADNLLRLTNPQEEVRRTLVRLLTEPIDDSERRFWLDLVRYTSVMNAPVNTALILERIMMNGK